MTETVEVPVKCVEDPPTIPDWDPPPRNSDDTWTYTKEDMAKLALTVHLLASWIQDAVDRCQVEENVEVPEVPTSKR